MIKKLLSLSFSVCVFFSVAQSFNGMYHFTGVLTGTASTGNTDPTPVPTANGLTFGSFAAVGFTNGPQAQSVFAFNSWGTGATNGDDVTFTGAVDLGQYYQVTLTPAASCTINFNSITFNASRSSTGPRNWVVRGSLDTYSTNLPASILPANPNISVQSGNKFFWLLDSYAATGGKQEAGNTITLGTSYSDQTNPVTFRFYAYNAEGTAGTFRIDTVIFNGTNNIPAGIHKVSYDLASKFNLYPNPTNDGFVFITSNQHAIKSVEVVDALGKVVLREEKNNSLETIKLNLGNLSNGTYYIKIFDGQYVSNEKIILTQ